MIIKGKNNHIVVDGQEVSQSGGGIGFCGLLTIVFIILKLCNVISWSWLWVLSPLWIPIVLTLAILLIILIAALIVESLD